jgi:integrase
MKPKRQRGGDYIRGQRGVYFYDGAWWVRYADEDGQIKRERIGTKALAIAVYQKRKTQVRERRLFPKQKDARIEKAIDDYMTRREGHFAQPKEYERYARRWKNLLKGKTVRKVCKADIETYVMARLKNVAPQTIKHELTFLTTFYRDCIEDGLADVSPTRGVRLGKFDNTRIRYLSPDEEVRLLSVLPERFLPIVNFAIHTGLRRAEQFNLRWSDVREDAVHIPRSKNGQWRDVPLNRIARLCLEQMSGRDPVRCFPYNAHNFVVREFKPAVDKASVDDFRWHDLRHTFASRLAMADVSIQTIKELLGHKTLAMTLRYAHLGAKHLATAVEKIARTSTPTGTKKSRVQKTQWAVQGSNLRHPACKADALPLS